MTRVLVTGVGVTSCLGIGADAFWRGLHARARGPVAGPDVDLPPIHRLPVDAIPDEPVALEGEPLGPTSRLALAVAREALADAQLQAGWGDARGQVVVGTGMGDARPHEHPRTGAPAATRTPRPAFGVSEAVRAGLGVTGVSSSVSNACAASGFAVALGADLIRSGEADVVLAGGAETYSRVALGCFARLRALDPVRCRPFDRHRAGTVFGEGAAMVVLESEEHARARRGPDARAELIGSGWSCDAHHATAPEPSGDQIVAAMRRALACGDVAPDDLGCVVPHGTGTELNDRIEARALHGALGSTARQVPLFSLKALIGHTGGAAGALAIAASVLMLQRGRVPPNARLDEQDPDCDVLLPQDGETPLVAPNALVNAYAFGGNNVSVLLRAAAA